MKQTLVLALLLVSTACLAQDDTAAISGLLSSTFDKPDVKVVTQPVVVEGDFALADWVQGHHGGRALLTRKDRQWKIVSCGGASLVKQRHLVEAGIPEQQASALVSRLTAAESGLDKKQVQLFDSFQGERAH